jgi:antitoxin component of RelBE/YafQ-DinJ toxin-antitoxin module
MHFFLPNYQRLSVAARKKILMALRNKMGMTVRKFIRMLRRKMAKSKIIRMPTVTKRMKCTVIVDHLC